MRQSQKIFSGSVIQPDYPIVFDCHIQLLSVFGGRPPFRFFRFAWSCLKYSGPRWAMACPTFLPSATMAGFFLRLFMPGACYSRSARCLSRRNRRNRNAAEGPWSFSLPRFLPRHANDRGAGPTCECVAAFPEAERQVARALMPRKLGDFYGERFERLSSRGNAKIAHLTFPPLLGQNPAIASPKYNIRLTNLTIRLA